MQNGALERTHIHVKSFEEPRGQRTNESPHSIYLDIEKSQVNISLVNRIFVIFNA